MNRTRDTGSQLSGLESNESEDGPFRLPQTREEVVAGNRPGASPLARGSTRLVLSDEDAGRVAVQWHVEQRDLQLLRGVFPSGSDPTPVIQLIRLTGPGQGEPIAGVPLCDAELLSEGQVSFELSGVGFSVQAELGLETPAGGWLLLVRSNPVTVSAGIVSTLPDVVPRELDSLIFEPALAATDADLVPVFPEAGVGAALPGMVTGAPPASSSAPGSTPVVEADTETPGPLSATHRSGSDAASPAERPRSSSYGISEPRYGAGGEGGLEVYTELLVHGRAKPGSEIDLFGHRIQIGSGGRFSLHLPVSNSELLKQALDQGLPLVARGRSDG